MDEAASHENKSFAVTRPAERQVSVLGFRVFMVKIYIARGMNKTSEAYCDSGSRCDGDGDDHLRATLAGILAYRIVSR